MLLVEENLHFDRKWGWGQRSLNMRDSVGLLGAVDYSN